MGFCIDYNGEEFKKLCDKYKDVSPVFLHRLINLYAKHNKLSENDMPAYNDPKIVEYIGDYVTVKPNEGSITCKNKWVAMEAKDMLSANSEKNNLRIVYLSDSSYEFIFPEKSKNKEQRMYDRMQLRLKIMTRFLKKHVIFNEKTHEYLLIDNNGRKIGAANTSVTRHLSDFLRSNFESDADILGQSKDSSKWYNVSTGIGDTVDAIVRDYFSGKLKDEYPNLKSDDLKAIIDDLDRFKEQRLDKKFGKGKYIVSTEKTHLMWIFENSLTKKAEYIGGEPDLLVIDEDGNLHIYDIKTKRDFNGKDNDHKFWYGTEWRYTNQLNMYKRAIETSFPGLFKNVIVEGLIVFNVNYTDARTEGVSYAKDLSNQVSILDERDGTKTQKNIQEDTNYAPPRIINDYIYIPKGKVEETRHFSAFEEKQVDFSDVTKRAISSTFESTPRPTSQISEQIKNLRNSHLLSLTDIQNVVVNISGNIYRLLLSYQTNPSSIPGVKITSKKKKLSLAAVLKKMPPSRLLNQIREEYFNVKGGNTAEGKLMAAIFQEEKRDDLVYLKMQEIYENFDAISFFVAKRLTVMTRFDFLNPMGINQREESSTLEKEYTDQIISPDDNQIYIFDEEESDKETAITWTDEMGTKDPMKSLAQEIRGHISVIPTGNHDEYGLAEYHDAKKIFYILMEMLHTKTTYADMRSVIENYKGINFTNLLKFLDSDPAIQSKFFNCFSKQRLSYTVIYTGKDKKLRTFFLGQDTASMKHVKAVLKGIQQGRAAKVFAFGERQISNIKNIAADVDEIQNSSNKKMLRENSLKKIKNILLDIGIPDNLSKTVLKEANKEEIQSVLRHIERLLIAYRANGRKTIPPWADGDIRAGYKALIKVLLRDTSPSETSMKYENSIFTNGKNYYLYGENGYISKLLSGDKEATKRKLEEFGKYSAFKDPVTGIWLNSYIEDVLLGRISPTIITHLNKDGKEFPHCTKLERAIINLCYFLCEDAGDGTAYYRLFPYGDKKVSQYILGTRHKDKEAIVSRLSKNILSEIVRIKEVIERAYNRFDTEDFRPIANYDLSLKDAKIVRKTLKNNGHKITIELLAKLDKTNSGAKFRVFPGLLAEMMNEKSSLKKDSREGFLSNLVNKINGEEAKMFSSYLKEIVSQQLDNVVDHEMKEFEEYGLFRAVTEKDEAGKEHIRYPNLSALPLDPNMDIEQIKNIIRSFIQNDFLTRTNTLQLTIGDVSYFKGTEDLQKRYSGVRAPGVSLNLNARDANGHLFSEDGKRRVIILDDIYIENTINGTTEKINMTDGQTLISVGGMRRLLGMRGKWSDEHERLYTRIVSGDKIAMGEISATMPIQKPVTFFLYDYGGSTPVPVFIKTSECVIDPRLSDIAGALHDFAIKYDIDAFVFKSAVKTGADIKAISIQGGSYDEIQKALRNAIAKETEGEVTFKDGYLLEVPFEHVLIQQELSNMETNSDAENIIRQGSQYVAITPADLPADAAISIDGKQYRGEEIRKRFYEIMAERVAYSIDEWMQGLSSTDVSTRIVDILTHEMEQRPELFTENEIELLQRGGTSEIIAHFFSPSKQLKTYGLLASIIRNRIVSPNISGKRYTIASSILLSSKQRPQLRFKKKDGSLIESFAEFNGSYDEYMKYVKELDGELAYFECYVSPPTYLKGYLQQEQLSVEDITKVDDECLKMIGIHLPTEHKYSITPLKIIGFLPSSMGDAIILPAEYSYVTGTDMDFDAIFCRYKKSEYNEERQKIVPIKDDKENTLFDATWEIFTNKTMKGQVLGHNNIESLRAIKNEIVELKKSKKQDNNPSLTSTTIGVENDNMNGRNIISTTAINATSHNYCSSPKGIRIQRDIGEKTFSGTIKIGKAYLSRIDEDGTPYITFDARVNSDGELTSIVLAHILACAVDNAKDPILPELNITDKTIGITATLARLGWGERTIGLFFAQPLVEKAFKYAESAGCSLRSAVYAIQQKYTISTNNNGEFEISDDELKKRIGKGDEDLDAIDMRLCMLLYDILDITEDANMLNKLTRVTAKRGLSKNIEGYFEDRENIIAFLEKIRTGRSVFNSEDIKNVLSNPYIQRLIQAQYGLNVEQRLSDLWEPHMTDQLDSDILYGFLQYSMYDNKIFKDVLSVLENEYDIHLDDTAISILQKALFTYLLTNGAEEGNSFITKEHIKKREWFFMELTKQIASFQANEKYKSNPLISSIVIESVNAANPSLFQISIDSKDFSKDQIIAAWEDLAKSDDEDTRILAENLFAYSLFIEGGRSNPKTLSYYQPSNTETARNYLQWVWQLLVDKDDYSRQDSIDPQTFIEQFLRNNPHVLYNIKQADITSTDGVTITKSGNSISFKHKLDKIPWVLKNNKTYFEGERTHKPYILYEDKLYYFVGITETEDLDSISAEYKELSPLGWGGKLFEFDATDTEIKSIFSEQWLIDRISANSGDNISIIEQDDGSGGNNIEEDESDTKRYSEMVRAASNLVSTNLKTEEWKTAAARNEIGVAKNKIKQLLEQEKAPEKVLEEVGDISEQDVLLTSGKASAQQEKYNNLFSDPYIATVFYLLSSKDNFKEYINRKLKQNNIHTAINPFSIIEIFPTIALNTFSKEIQYSFRGSNGKYKKFTSVFKAYMAAVDFNNNENKNGFFAQVVRDENNEAYVKIDQTATVDKDVVFKSSLNHKLLELLRGAGFDVEYGVDGDVAGVFSPNTATINAKNLISIIRIAKGEQGEAAFPEEIAHFLISGLHNSTLVKRLLNSLQSMDVIEKVLDKDFAKYKELYNDDLMLLREEAAGKLLAQSIINQDSNTIVNSRKSILQRVWDFIKKLFLTISEKHILEAEANARMAADELASKIMTDNKTISRGLDIKNILRVQQTLAKIQSTNQKQEDTAARLRAIANKKIKNLKGSTEEQELVRKWRRVINTNEKAVIYTRFIDAATSEMKAIQQAKTIAMKKLRDSKLGTLGAFEQACIIAKHLIRIANYRDTYGSILGQIYKERPDLQANVLLGIINKEMGSFIKDREFIIKAAISPFFSESGELITVGKRKGEKMTADEFISYLDAEGGFLDRYIYALGDSPDPFLNIINNIVAYIKRWRVEKDISTIRARVESAYNTFLKADPTNGDTSFIYAKDKDGAPTGYIIADRDYALFERRKEAYIQRLREDGCTAREFAQKLKKWIEDNTEVLPAKEVNGLGELKERRIPSREYFSKDLEKLSPSQRKLYDTLFDINRWLSDLTGYNLIYIVPQISKDSKNIKGVKKTIKTYLQKQISRIVRDEEVYEENQNIKEGVEPRSTPFLFTKKIIDVKRLSTENYVEATLKRAIAGITYFHLNSVCDLIMLMRDQAASRATKRSGGIQVISGKQLATPSNKGVRNTVALLDDFIAREIFLEGYKNSPTFTIGGRVIDQNSVLSLFQQYAGVLGLGLNVFAGITNVLMGKLQMFYETIGGQEFGWKESARATKEFYGLVPEYLAEIGSVYPHGKLSLLLALFDPLEDFFQNSQYKNYNSNGLRRLWNNSSSYILNNMGEFYLHSQTMLAILYGTKVLNKEGKETALYDQLEIFDDKGVMKLRLKEGIKRLDGTLLSTTGLDPSSPVYKNAAIEQDAFLFRIKRRIGSINQHLFGAFNPQDKGMIHRHALGRLVMQFRQWMPAHAKRRYAKTHFNAATGEWEEGFYRTFLRFNYELLKELRHGKFQLATRWGDLSGYEKGNIKKAISELGAYVALSFLISLIGPPSDLDKEFIPRSTFYQLVRMRAEIGGFIPTLTTLRNMVELIDSPAAATQQLSNIIKILEVQNMLATIDAGRYKGKNKWANDAMQLIPYYRQIKNIGDIATQNTMFSYYLK